MDRINLPASIQNLPNVEKLQQREVANPVIHSIQNSTSDALRHEERMQKPNEVDATENRTIDPDERKKQGQSKKRHDKRKPDHKNHGKDSGHFIDYSA